MRTNASRTPCNTHLQEAHEEYKAALAAIVAKYDAVNNPLRITTTATSQAHNSLQPAQPYHDGRLQRHLQQGAAPQTSSPSSSSSEKLASWQQQRSPFAADDNSDSDSDSEEGGSRGRVTVRGPDGALYRDWSAESSSVEELIAELRLEHEVSLCISTASRIMNTSVHTTTLLQVL